MPEHPPKNEMDLSDNEVFTYEITPGILMDFVDLLRRSHVLEFLCHYASRVDQELQKYLQDCETFSELRFDHIYVIYTYVFIYQFLYSFLC